MILSTEDLRKLARRRIPRAIFDYADGGSYDERTIRANADDLDAMKFRQRVMIDVSQVTLADHGARRIDLDAARHRAHRPLRTVSRRR